MTKKGRWWWPKKNCLSDRFSRKGKLINQGMVLHPSLRVEWRNENSVMVWWKDLPAVQQWGYTWRQFLLLLAGLRWNGNVRRCVWSSGGILGSWWIRLRKYCRKAYEVFVSSQEWFQVEGVATMHFPWLLHMQPHTLPQWWREKHIADDGCSRLWGPRLEERWSLKLIAGCWHLQHSLSQNNRQEWPLKDHSVDRNFLCLVDISRFS